MQITVHHADLVKMGGGRAWMVGTLVEADDATAQRMGLPTGGGPVAMVSVLPEEMFENLAVEYGLDPDDFDILLDVALYLPYVDDPITHDHPKAPHLVDDIAEAREHVLDQVRAKKGRGRVAGEKGRSKIGAAGPLMQILADSGVEDPIEVLRREMPMSLPHIEIKREAYRQQRDRVRRERGARAAVQQERRVGAGRSRETPEEMRTRLIAERALPAPEEPGDEHASSTP
jgi:hypothetical protein